MTNLQDTLLTCFACGDLCKDGDGHVKNKHDGSGSHTRFYDSVIFCPGPGHFEMNMSKKLLALCWEPFLKHFSVLLGYQTSGAQDAFRQGVDHHRSRAVLSACLASLSSELVPFVRYCQSKKCQATPNS